MRAYITGCTILVLAACQPQIPDSAAGVGFDNANLSPQPAPNNATVTAAIPPSSTVAATPLRTAPTAPVVAQAPAAKPVRKPAATPAPAPRATTPAAPVVATARTSEPPSPAVRKPGQAQTTPDGIVHASPSNPAPVVVDKPGLSDENNFAAVGARRSIEADAARIKTNRENYQVIAPTALPERTDTGPNIVQYALSTSNSVGTKLYKRLSFLTKGRAKKACAGFPSDTEAQAAFLSKGGPKVDRLGLDPDGDGFACGWSPAPYRKAARGG